MPTPLADRIRPRTLAEMVGQQHILGSSGLLTRLAAGKSIPNMIFYGPSGVGKTTAARIIASGAGKNLYKLNGTTASTGDIKALIKDLDGLAGVGGVVLYLDEIQYLNKKQQQTLLEFIEDGSVTLIASTTENPYFYVYNAILSRSTVFEFKPVGAKDIEAALRRALETLGEDYPGLTLEDGVIEHIALSSGGDVRKGINALELCCMAAASSETSRTVTLDDALTASKYNPMSYNPTGDSHYDSISALQKSIRGSDENAALHYLAALLEAGDILSPCRRLLVIASEDIGLAYPMAMPVVKACVDSAMQLGLPEARLPLAEAVVFLATLPKSNSAYLAYSAAADDVKTVTAMTFPRSVQNVHADGAQVKDKRQNYKYPHDYPNHYVPQQYMPDELKDRVYYKYGDNKVENAAKQYWEKIKGK